MFTTYRVPPLRRSGLGGSTRPINQLLVHTRCAFKRLKARVSASDSGRSGKRQTKSGSNLATAA